MRIRLALLADPDFVGRAGCPIGRGRGDRFALVIGNSKYPDAEAPLKEPINDAREIADELKRDGFNVEVGENLTGDGMRRAFDHLYGSVKPGSVALIFYSGFGIQSGRQSYMIPVDAQIWTEADVRRDGFSLETVLGEINSRGAGVKIALVDASRRNPFERRFRSFSAGLAPVIAPNGTLVMYSAALSLGDLRQWRRPQPVRQELLKEIRVPDLMAEETLNRTRVGVTRASRSEQVPWISSSLAEDFSFIPGAGSVRRAAAPPPRSGRRRSRATPPPLPPSQAGRPQSHAPSTPPPPQPAGCRSHCRRRTAEAGRIDPAPTTPSADAGALADDPTIKSLTDKLADNPDDGERAVPARAGLCQQGRLRLAIKDFDDSLRLNPKDVEAFNNRCWARTVIGDLQAALEGLQRGASAAPEFRRCSRQPRPCQSEERADQERDCRFRCGAEDQSEIDVLALRPRPRQAAQRRGRGGRSGYSQRQGDGPEYCQGVRRYGVR